MVSFSVGMVVLFGGITPCRCKRAVQQRWCESSWPAPSWNRSITRKPKSRQITKFYFAIIKQLLNINPRKEKTKKRKKEKRRRLATNVFSSTSTITNLICYRRCVRRGFICKSFYIFLKFLIRPGSCRVRSPSVWVVRLFHFLFMWEEWWLNFRGSISTQQIFLSFPLSPLYTGFVSISVFLKTLGEG